MHIAYHFQYEVELHVEPVEHTVPIVGRIARINREISSRCENSTRSVPTQGIAERRFVITVAKSLISTISLILYK